MTSLTNFKAVLPNAYFLDAADVPALQNYLVKQGWITPSSRIQSVTKAGEGNMNCVLRVRLANPGSFIIKQSRPWVEKFPEIAAPAERANAEGLFYRETSRNSVIAGYSPELLHADPDSHILMIEDLGVGADLSNHYSDGSEIDGATLSSLLRYLSALHADFRRDSCDFYIENRGMRELNAEHIFRFPFAPGNGLDLDDITPGLAAIGRQYQQDTELLSRIKMLEQRYLRNGDTLLHGDFYPGSLISTDSGIKVIDAEFCFFGDAEFDLGVFQANLMLAQQPDSVLKDVMTLYQKPAGFSDTLYLQYTGIEILRRILGLAQLPLSLDLAGKELLLGKARSMLMAG